MLVGATGRTPRYKDMVHDLKVDGDMMGKVGINNLLKELGGMFNSLRWVVQERTDSWS